MNSSGVLLSNLRSKDDRLLSFNIDNQYCQFSLLDSSVFYGISDKA